jgi:hypothetical protein
MILITLTLKKLDLVPHYPGTATMVLSGTQSILVPRLHLFQYQGSSFIRYQLSSSIWYKLCASSGTSLHLFWYQGSSFIWYQLSASSGTISPPLSVPSFIRYQLSSFIWYQLYTSSGTSFHTRLHLLWYYHHVGPVPIVMIVFIWY